MLQGVGVGVFLVSPSGNQMRYVLRLNFKGPTNNIAEYEALLHGLRTAVTLGVRRFVASGDSKLVVRQVMKASACRDHRWKLTALRSKNLRQSLMDLNYAISLKGQ
jgi:ribonuclease HI